MSSQRLLVVCLLLLLMLGGAATVFLLQPQFAPRGRLIAVSNASNESRVDPLKKSGPSARCAPETSGTVVNQTTPLDAVIKSSPPTAAKARIKIEDLEDGQVLVRAKLQLKGGPGLELFRDGVREEVPFIVEFMGPDDDQYQYYWDAGFDGDLETVVDREELPLTESGELKSGQWSADLAWNDTNALPIRTPVLTGRVLDFGSLDFEISNVLDANEYIVMGQAVHASGIPMAGVWLNMLTSCEGIDTWNEVNVDSTGRFIFTLWESNATLQCQWSYSYREAEDLVPLEAPKLEGRVYDFGKLVITCAAVEICVKGWMDDAQRRALAGEGVDLTKLLEPFLKVSFENYAESDDCVIAQSEGLAYMFLAPGPYRYNTDAHDCLACYEPTSGTIDAKRDKVTKLGVQLTRVGSLVVRVVSAEGPVFHAHVELVWENPGGAPAFHKLNVDLPHQPWAWAYPRDSKVTLKASGDGWSPVTVEVAPGAQSVTVTLTEKRALSEGEGEVEVTVPKLPGVITAHHFQMQLVARTEVAGKEPVFVFLAQVFTDSDSPYCHALPAGEWSILLQEERPYFGYPGGVVSGPVRVSVVGGQTTGVTLPAIAAPLWESGVKGFVADIQCEGRPVSLEGSGFANGKAVVIGLEAGKLCQVPMQAYAIKDGEAEVPLEVTGPAGPKENGRIYRNFASRIEVRVKRDGKPATGTFEASGYLTAKGQCHCSRRGAENESSLFLWLPAGDARVVLNSAGLCGMSRDVVVKSNECIVVEFALNSNSLELTWDERYSSGDGAQWLIKDAKGAFVATALNQVRHIELPRGRYTIAPFGLADDKLTLQFEIPESGVARLSLPFVSAVQFTGSLVVPLPEGLKPDPDGYVVHVCWFPAAYGDMITGGNAIEITGDPVETRVTDESLRILYLPTGMEVVVFASIANMEESSSSNAFHRSWTAAPRRIKLDDAKPQSLANPWSLAVTKNNQWADSSAEFKLFPVSNPMGVYYDEYWAILPADTYICRWRYLPEGESTPAEVETIVTLVREDGKYCALPDNLAAEWKAKGLIADDE